MEQKYICRYCGKECKNENSLRNHERLCKSNPNHQQHTGFVYGWSKGLNKENSEVYKKISEKAKAKHYKEFIPYYCEKCGKLVKEKYASGRFCSRKCANSHILTQEQKLHISLGVIKSIIKAETKKHKNIKIKFKYNIKQAKEKIEICNKICPICGKQYTGKNKTCSRECGQVHRIKITGIKEETRKKLSAAVQNRIKNGTHKGWTTRNIESFAERFFKRVLENNNISYEFNKPIEKNKLGIQENGCYFLDFALSNKIDLEIDGKQHKLEDRRAHDKIRDERLTNNGWKVYRIEWKSLPKNNEYIKNEIDKFLAWYQKEGQVAQE